MKGIRKSVVQSLEKCVVIPDETWISSDHVNKVVRGGFIVRFGTK